MAEQTQQRSGCSNKHKAKQSSKKRAYYKNQFLVTGANKVRRARKRQMNAAKWAAIKAA